MYFSPLFSPLNGVAIGHVRGLLVLKIHPKIAGGWITIRNDSIGPFGVNAAIGDVAITLYIYIWVPIRTHILYIWNFIGLCIGLYDRRIRKNNADWLIHDNLVM